MYVLVNSINSIMFICYSKTPYLKNPILYFSRGKIRYTAFTSHVHVTFTVKKSIELFFLEDFYFNYFTIGCNISIQCLTGWILLHQINYLFVIHKSKITNISNLKENSNRIPLSNLSNIILDSYINLLYWA